MFRKFHLSACVLASLFLLTAGSHAQISTVDPSFATVPSAKFETGTINNKGILAQTDGRAVIWGGNLVVDGVAKGHVARLNVDGTLDTSFSYCNCLLTTLANVAIEADRKILIAGSINSHAKIARLNPDGSQDLSFTGVLNDGGSSSSTATINTIQADGKILVELTQGFNSGFHRGDVVRLNTDGTLDTGFTPIGFDAGQILSGALTGLAVGPTGEIYAALTTYSIGTSSTLKKYNSNGTVDSSWSTPNIAPSGSVLISGLAVQPDGALLLAGRFESVNGVDRPNIARLLPAGNVDLNFNPPRLGSGAGQMQILSDSKILVAYHITGNGLLARLNSNGSLDATFALAPTVSVVLSKFAIDPSGRILFFGTSNQGFGPFFRLNPNGDQDTSFNPNATMFAIVRALAQTADGKIVMSGNFSQINGVPRSTIAGINADGTLDPIFDPNTGFNSPPARLVVQPDGKIIAAGEFISYNGASRPGLVRINADGSIDSSFNPSIAGNVFVASVQSDGKVLIGGSFTSVDGTARTGVARLTSTGVLDLAFAPIFGNPSITEIFEQPDGKIMVGGSFSGVNGFNRTSMVRLNSDGTLDQTFDATGIGTVSRIWLQPDGKYMVDGIALRRRLASGAPDASFGGPTLDTLNASGRSIDAVIAQSDGTYVVGGRFDTVNGVVRRNLIRLNSTGGVDPLFFPNGADGPVRAAIRQADGRLVVGGEFARIGTVTRSGIARLNIVPFQRPTPFDFDGDGRADISVVRPSTNRWYEALSSTNQVYEESFGVAGDVLAPADFDGDGVTDEAIYRPSNGQWWYRSSVNGSLVLNPFGNNGDIPRPSDFDGDGRADFILFRPSNNTWYRVGSLTPGQQATPFTFGIAGDQPLIGDFDGDGRSDPAIFRPSNGDWWYAASSAGGAFRTAHWGQSGDIPVQADYDGDGKTDYAIYRPSDGGWYIYNSGNGSITTTAFGVSTDRPVAADYDGDGRADLAVFRPSTGIWYLLRSTSGFAGYQFGISTDIAIPGSLIP